MKIILLLAFFSVSAQSALADEDLERAPIDQFLAALEGTYRAEAGQGSNCAERIAVRRVLPPSSGSITLEFSNHAWDSEYRFHGWIERIDGPVDRRYDYVNHYVDDRVVRRGLTIVTERRECRAPFLWPARCSGWRRISPSLEVDRHATHLRLDDGEGWWQPAPPQSGPVSSICRFVRE